MQRSSKPFQTRSAWTHTLTSHRFDVSPPGLQIVHLWTAEHEESATDGGGGHLNLYRRDESCCHTDIGVMVHTHVHTLSLRGDIWRQVRLFPLALALKCRPLFLGWCEVNHIAASHFRPLSCCAQTKRGTLKWKTQCACSQLRGSIPNRKSL